MVNSDILFLYKKLSIVSICNSKVCKCNVKNNNILQNKIKFDCPNLCPKFIIYFNKIISSRISNSNIDENKEDKIKEFLKSCKKSEK